MSGDGVAVEDVVFTGFRTDIMDNQWPIADFFDRRQCRYGDGFLLVPKLQYRQLDSLYLERPSLDA